MPLAGYDIVCFSNDWGGDPLSKMHLMRRAARENRVLWVNSLGNRAPRATGRDLERIRRKVLAAFGGLQEVAPNLHVLSPLALPPDARGWSSTVNAPLLELQVRTAMRRLGMVRPIAFSYLPAAAPVFDRLGARLNVYHCVDDFTAFEGAGERIATLERELIGKSDVVICSAELLAQEKARLHPRVELVRHGVDLDHFLPATEPTTPVSPLVARLPHPVVGFVGLVAEWVNQALLVEIARRHPTGSVVVVGREDAPTDRLRAEPNVTLLGRRPYAELPAILKGFDLGLVPFLDGPLARAANPLKAREYLAAGLPVVSTPIAEVARLPGVRIAQGHAEFLEAVDATLADAPGPQRARAAAMRSESWDARWDEVAMIVRRLIDEAEPARHHG